MRIGIDIRKYFDFGIGTYIQNLVAAYRERNDIEVTLFAAEEQIFRLQELKPASFIVENSSKYSLQELFSLGQKANKANIDLLHVPHYTLPLLLKKKSVVTIHDLIHFRLPEYFSKIQRTYAFLMIRHACRNSSHIVVDSDYTKNDILRSFDVDERKITTIPLGVNPIYFQEVDEKRKSEFKKRYNITKPYILYTGSLKPHKNIQLLLEAFTIVRKSFDVQMVMAGEAVKDQPRIASQIDSMKCTEHVFSVEHLTQDELTIAYHASEAVVLPSLYEGFGFSMVEAMASGVPTLGANATSIPGVVGDGGILFDPFDKNDLAENILRVLNDKNLRKDLIVKGLKQAKQFTWEKCAEQTIDIYRKTLV